MYELNEKDRYVWLEKTIESEKRKKMLDMINKIYEYTGDITDASNIKIGLKGDINGIIKGKKGSVRIETIGAGGYNIQSFHFRTLIHKI